MNKLFLSILAVFIVLGGLAVIRTTKLTASTVFLPSDLASKRTGNPDVRLMRIRVGGRVSSLPVDYKVQPVIELKFSITDPGIKSEGPETQTVPVIYNGLKPDMFAPGRDVIIDGEFVNGVLVANKLLTQCPSKYEPPDPENHDKS